MARIAPAVLTDSQWHNAQITTERIVPSGGRSLQSHSGGFGQLLAAISLGAAALLFALLALRDKVHLLAIGLGDPLGDDTLIKAANQLLNGFAFTTLNSHSAAGSAARRPVHGTEPLAGVGQRPVPWSYPRSSAITSFAVDLVRPSLRQNHRS